MTTRRKSHESDGHDRTNRTPVQEDEADILEEAGTAPDEATGGLVVNEETVRELGAVDATSVRENRRLTRVVEKKRAGEKDVPFNTKDPIVIYDTLLRYWTPDAIEIKVTRLLGGASTMLNRPVNSAAMFEAITHFHGQHAETEYEVKFLSSGKYMGLGRITLPDTRVTQQQQGQQPMQYGNGVPPQGYQQTSGYAQAPQGYPPQQVVLPSILGQTPPQAPFDPMAMMSQMFDMFQKMSQRAQPSAPPVMMPSAPAPQVAPTDPAAMMQQMFDMFLKMQGLPAASMPAPQPVVVAAPPPPAAPQPSIDPMAMMRQMFDMFRDMQASLTPRSSPMRRPADGPQGDEPPPYARSAYGSPQQPPPQPQREKTMAETFRESIGVVRTAVDMMQEMEGLLPSREAQESHSSPDDDDSPFRVIDTGAAKLVVNKMDGSTRLWETGLANMPEIFKWVGEQRKEIQEEARQRRQQQAPAPQRQIPAGFVEVGPGYRPPPGYVAVAVEESDLPPPPSDVPPPIQEPPPPARPAWGAPTIPDEEGENQ